MIIEKLQEMLLLIILHPYKPQLQTIKMFLSTFKFFFTKIILFFHNNKQIF